MSKCKGGAEVGRGDRADNCAGNCAGAEQAHTRVGEVQRFCRGAEVQSAQ